MDNTSFVILPVEKVREMIEIAVSGCFDKALAALQPRQESVEGIGKESIVILSTHIVSDVEHIADYILMMKGGKIVFNAPREEIQGDLEEFYLGEFED